MSKWEDAPSNDGWETATWEDAPQPKRKTSVIEDIGMGLKAGIYDPTIGNTLMAAGGLSSYAGMEGVSDALFKTYDYLEDKLKSAEGEQGLGGKLITGGTTMIAPMSVGMKLAGAAPTLAAAGKAGLKAMGAFSASQVAPEAKRAVEAGSPADKALLAAGVNQSINAASGAIPFAAPSRLAGAAWGAGSNVVGGQVGREAAESILGGTGGARNYEFNPEDAAVDLILGGGFGALAGRSAPVEQRPGKEKVQPTTQADADIAIRRQADFSIQKAGAEVDRLTSIKDRTQAQINEIKDRIASNGGATTQQEQHRLRTLENRIAGIQPKLDKETAVLNNSLEVRSRYGDEPVIKPTEEVLPVEEVPGRTEPTVPTELPLTEQSGSKTDPDIVGPTEVKLSEADQNFQKALDDMKSSVGEIMSALAEASGTKMNFNPTEGLGKAMSNLADALYRAGHTTYIKAVAAAKAQLGNAWDRVKYFFKQAWDHNRNQNSNQVTKRIPGLNKAFDNINKVIGFNQIKSMVLNNQLGDPPSSILRKMGLNYFGDQQYIHSIKDSMPYVYNAYKVIKATGDTAIRMSRTWLNDYDSSKVEVIGKGFWNKLTAYKNPDSVNETWHKGSWQDVETVYGMFKKAFDSDTTLREYYDNNHTQLSEMQRKMYSAAMKMFEKMHMETGIKSYRNGWFPVLRRGDFLVTVRDEKGTPFHLETFRTSEEARIFERQVAKSTKYKTNMIDKKSNPSIFDHLNGIGEMFGKNPTPEQIQAMRTIDEVRQRMAENAGLGGHDKHRLGFSGFEGNRWFKTREQNAEDFRKAVFDSAQEYSSLYRKRMLSTLAEGFVRDPDIAAKIPLQVEFTDHLFRNAMNEMDGFGTMTVDGKKVSIDREFKGWIDNQVVKSIDQFNRKFGTDLPMPKHSLLDRSHGIAAQLFYISALTTRPAFWAAQVLTAPFALRGILREGSMVDVANATGRGMWNVLNGGDQQFRNFIKDVANTTDSLHPQFMNDINSIGRQWLADGKHATIKSMFEWGTGQAPGAIADSISRYITMAIGYEFYKPLVKNKAELRNQVTAFSDATMVMYSREHVSPMIQKLGTVGEMVAPLTKYPTAQLGNLIADLKLIKDKKTFRSTLPAMSTLLTLMIMGGTMGTVLVAEYELLRTVLTALAEQFGLTDEAEEILPPSAEKAILENSFLMQKALADSYGLIPGVDQERAKRMAQFGIVSGLAGFDIGSGLRFQGFTPELLEDPNKGIFSLMPAVAFAKQLIQAGLTEAKPENTLAEDRKTWMGMQPFVGAKALIDRTMFDSGTREFVPDSRYDAQVPQRVEEEIGTLIGSRPTETAQKARMNFHFNKEQQKLKNRYDRKLTLVTDQITRGNIPDPEKLQDLVEFGMTRLGKSPESVFTGIETLLKKRNIPQDIRIKIGTDLGLSQEDIVRIMQYQRME